MIVIPSLPSSVRLVAVTKGRSVAEIEDLIAEGVIWFGENRLNEIQTKWPFLKEKYPHVRLQFIGQLQSNKVARILKHCDSLLSIDRKSLLEAIATAQKNDTSSKEYLIQVNLAKEPQKGGVIPENLKELIVCARSHTLPIQGLSAIPPLRQDPTPYFTQLKALCTLYNLKECSMGMSDDFDTAIALGATQVRLGRRLFR